MIKHDIPAHELVRLPWPDELQDYVVAKKMPDAAATRLAFELWRLFQCTYRSYGGREGSYSHWTPSSGG